MSSYNFVTALQTGPQTPQERRDAAQRPTAGAMGGRDSKKTLIVQEPVEKQAEKDHATDALLLSVSKFVKSQQGEIIKKSLFHPFNG